jgi:peptide/nickel transport system permease protein
VLRHRGLVAGSAIFVAILVLGLLAPLFAPFDPVAQSLANRMIPPVFLEGGTWSHPLGTDALGRDYLSRLIYGTRVSLTVAVVAVAVSGLIGTALGVAAGYFGGRVDAAIMFFVTTRLAMPVALVALAVVAQFGASLGLLVLVLGLLVWDRFAIVTRNATALIAHMDYVTAARAVGASNARIVLAEVLPNLLPVIIVIATFEAANVVLLEAAFSFLGLGVQPPTPSWGLMIAEGREQLLFKPWMVTIPGIAIALLALAINLLGDGLRDLLAPDATL